MAAKSIGEPYIEALGDLVPTIDASAFVHPRATVIGEVTIGADSSVWVNATLRGDEGFIRVGASTNLQDGVVVHNTGGRSNSVIGDRVTVGHSAIIHGACIGDGTLVGMGAILLDNVEIGELCIVGAGSLVTKGIVVPPRSVVLGRPPKLIIRPITDQELEANQGSWARYVEQARRYRQHARRLSEQR